MSDTKDQTEAPSGLGGEEIDPSMAMSLLAEATDPTSDVPVIDQPMSGDVVLMWGIKRGEDRLRNATVRELNGADEEAIAKIDRRVWTFDHTLTNTVLTRAVLTIGSVDVQKEPGAVHELLIGDRDLLFRRILLATYGEVQEFKDVECIECRARMDLDINITELTEVRDLDVDPENIPVTLRDGSEAVFRYTVGTDLNAVFQGASEPTMAEINTEMIARCVVSLSGRAVLNPLEWARQLGIKDRQAIVQALGQQPAVTFKEVEVPCVQCGKNMPPVVGWANLLPL